MIFLLEDNDDRVSRLERAAALVAPTLGLRVWRSAPAMLADLVDGLEHASLICLDHDLVPQPGEAADLGTGYDVALVLAELIPCCPILIHTSNTERGNWMTAVLRRGGWTVDRVYPFGDEWIERDWSPRARALLTRG